MQLAQSPEQFQNLGQDLVAMCVNDLICCGAKPLLFSDYYATSDLKIHEAKALLTGILKACETCGTLLCGGETAEMPGIYPKGGFDCAGFAIGLVDEKNLLGPHKVKEGQQLLGLASSGLHSNGFSLIRKLFDLEKEPSWRESLLTPTLLYPPVLEMLQQNNGGNRRNEGNGGNRVRMQAQGTATGTGTRHRYSHRYRYRHTGTGTGTGTATGTGTSLCPYYRGGHSQCPEGPSPRPPLENKTLALASYL